MGVNIQWYQAKHGLSQAVTSGLEFALVSADNRQSCQFAHCKDFIHDAVRAFITQKQEPIYKFDYDPINDPPVDLERLRLVGANCEDGELRNKIPACIEFIRQIEDRLGMGHSEISECANPPAKYQRGGVWLFEADRRWMLAPPMLSLYILLLRVGMGHTLGQSFEQTINDIVSGSRNSYLSVDKGRLSSGGKAGLERILAQGDRVFFPDNIRDNYSRTVDINTFHNYFGVVGWVSGSTRKYYPEWQ